MLISCSAEHDSVLVLSPEGAALKPIDMPLSWHILWFEIVGSTMFTLLENTDTGDVRFVGFDRTGKSEISQALARVFDWTYFKNRNEGLRFDPNENSKLAFKYETQYMCNILEQFRLNGVVLDRSIPCEYAYAKALNRDFDEELV